MFQRAELFRDSDHLNRVGSETFSTMLVDELKHRLAQHKSFNQAPKE